MTIDYRPLNRINPEIRLLEIASQRQDPRCKLLPACRIFHVPLQTNPRFVALSYTWGDLGKQRVILVDEVPVYITANLYEAIMALRHPDRALVIWVDALCINQDDDLEKSWQVSLMRDIYQQASQVLAWLGPADDDSDQVITFLNTVGQKAGACGIEFVHGPHLSLWTALVDKDVTAAKQDALPFCVGVTSQGIQIVSRQALEDLFRSVSGWYEADSLFPVAGMRRLFTRPWWGRVWVLQEIALSESAYFVCGTQKISRRRCRAALSVYVGLWMILMRQAHNRTLQPTSYHLAIITSLFHHRPNVMLCSQDLHRRDRFPLAAFLRATCVGSSNSRRHGPHHLESTDPRDKVFALLSLASDQQELQQRGVYPDYTKNCVDVYTSTMAVLLEQGHMSLLSLCQLPKVQQRLPSWVVDWSRSATDMLQDVHNDHVTLDPAFAASGRDERGSNVVIERQHGKVTGITLTCILFDQVLAVGSFQSRVCTHEVPLVETYSWPGQWLIEILRLSYLSRKHLAFEERLAAAARTSIAEVGYNQDGRLARIGNERFADATILLKSSLRFIEHHQALLDAKRFLTTPAGKTVASGEGHLILSSEYVRSGDAVALVKGSQIPFVLRHHQGGRYSLIGEAYVDGIMDGEAANPTNFQPVQLV